MRFPSFQLVFFFFYFGTFLELGGGKVNFGAKSVEEEEESSNAVRGRNPFHGYRKNYWYHYSTPQSTSLAEYIDYHLSPGPITTLSPDGRQAILSAPGKGLEANVSVQLGTQASLKCLIQHLGDKTVSWLKRPSSLTADALPVLLTFGETIYVNDVRVTVSITNRGNRKEEWCLKILNAQKSDQGLYECQISTEPPITHKINLVVDTPVLTVMDGFGRELVDQYYKVGSSLEVICAVDRLPARPLPGVIEWRYGNRVLEPHNVTRGHSIYFSYTTDGAVSRMVIGDARVAHSGIYTCSISDTISQSLRLHIIDGDLEYDMDNALYKRVVCQMPEICEECILEGLMGEEVPHWEKTEEYAFCVAGCLSIFVNKIASPDHKINGESKIHRNNYLGICKQNSHDL